MDSILALLVVLWIFGSLVKASKGKSAAKKQSVHRTVRPEETPPPAPPSGRAAAAADRKKKPAASRAQAPAVSAEGRDTCDPSLGHDPRRTVPYGGSLGAVSAEGRDTCDPSLGHDPRRTVPYGGSLGAVSAEGRDTCDPSLGHERRSVEPADDAYALDEGLVPELDAQMLIQGIVMSEILKRPYERKWGRR